MPAKYECVALVASGSPEAAMCRGPRDILCIGRKLYKYHPRGRLIDRLLALMHASSESVSLVESFGG